MSDISITVRPPVGMITLRGDMTALGKATKKVAACALPPMRMSTASDTGRLMWMSPDELMLVCDHSDADRLVVDLTQVLGTAFTTVINVSDSRQLFDIKGIYVENVLSKLMPVDFDTFAETEVRRTRMAQIPAAIWREGDHWRVMCFRSVAVYAEDVLRNAMPVGA